MISLQDIQKLRNTVATAQRDYERAAGRLEQLLEQLKEETGCDTLESAESKLNKLQARLSKYEQRFEKLYDAFMQKWGEWVAEAEKEAAGDL
jgi:chromosome segregation ATPase